MKLISFISNFFILFCTYQWLKVYFLGDLIHSLVVSGSTFTKYSGNQCFKQKIVNRKNINNYTTINEQNKVENRP